MVPIVTHGWFTYYTQDWISNFKHKPQGETVISGHNLWPFVSEQEISPVPDVCNRYPCEISAEGTGSSSNSPLSRLWKEAWLSSLSSHSLPPLLSPACLWIHEINWRHGNMLRDWMMATNLVKEPLLKGGLTNRQPSLTHFCCFAFCDELEEEKRDLFNISLWRKISHLTLFFLFLFFHWIMLKSVQRDWWTIKHWFDLHPWATIIFHFIFN